MKVIALRGGENTGKSHTINMVYAFLLREGYIQELGHFEILGNPHFEDIIDVLVRNEVRIGILGIGDYVNGTNSTRNRLRQLELAECHFVFCSCRNKPKIEDAIRAYPDHIFIDKTISAGRENDRIVNVFDAERMINEMTV